jgi:aminoglycoside phosphotransferase (APT) family kinase protein
MTDLGVTGEGLQRFLDAVEPGRAATVAAVTPLSGGYSRDTAIGEVVWGDGERQRLVLRSDPPPDTGVFVSDRDDEWRLLRALGRTTGPVRVPAARWYDSTGEYFGAKCIIGDFYEGSRNLQDVAREAPDLTEACNAFVDVMADIHATPVEDLPAELSRPADWDSYIDGLFDLIDHNARAGLDSAPALRYAAGRLREFRPPPVPLTLVHGDCQPGNVLLGDAGPTVIDWEFGRIGDPREDIGYYHQIPIPPNLYHTDPDAFLARYRERTGLSEEQLNPDVVEYFMVLGIARLSGQMLRGADAVARGGSRGVMATYLINANSLQYRNHFETARRLGDGVGRLWSKRRSATSESAGLARSESR